MSDKFTCGRRNSAFSPGAGIANEDEWRRDDTCSYCGSISPDAFFEAIESGAEIGPTVRPYFTQVVSHDYEVDAAE